MKARVPLLLVGSMVGAIAIGVAACDGGDEGDDTSPVPSPTAANPDYCVLEWQSDGGGGTVNVYRLTARSALWSGPVNDYANPGIFAIAAYRVPLNADSLFDAKIVTSPSNGTFSTSAVGVEQGNVIALSDTRKQPVFVLSTALVRGAVAGSAGVGSFTGSWSEFATAPNLATFGVGQMTIVGTNFQTATIPSATSNAFGICYHDAAAVLHIPVEFPLRRAD